MSLGYYSQGSPGRESGVVSDCDTMAELAALLRSEIPEGRSNLSDNHSNLQRVAEYCEANYFQTDNKRGALEETKNYTTQSLASVAYQINTLAYNFLQLLEMQSAQLAEMESQMNHISQTVMIHKEKVARREIGVLTANKSTNRQYKIIAPANPEKPIKYLRKAIDYTIFDDIGHGVRSGGTPRQKQRGSSSGSIQSVNSLQGIQGNMVGPAPTTKPPTPPQISRTNSKVSVVSGGTLSKSSREYRTPPAVAPPQVPSHYAPNYPIGHPRRESGGPGYRALPLANQQPQVGMVHPMTQQQQVIQPQTPPPPPPQNHATSLYGQEIHNLPPPPSPLINSQEMVLSSNQHHPMMMGGHHNPVPHGSLGMHTLSHAQGHRMSQALQQQLQAARGSGSQSPPLPPPPPPEDVHEAFGRPRNSSGGVMPIVPDEEDLPGWVPKNYIEKVVAIYDYYADKDDELSFQESSVIYVLKKNDDGWWEGVMDGITGLFPGNYVEPCVWFSRRFLRVKMRLNAGFDSVRWFLRAKSVSFWYLAVVLVNFGDGSPLDPVKHIVGFDLNSWIKQYDVAIYDVQSLNRQHRRIRRSSHDAHASSQGQGLVRLKVKGHGRTFKLLLYPDNDIFAEDVIFESTSRPSIDFNRSTVYKGTLEDDDTALVHGIITTNGLFEGSITTQTEEYHIEPVSRYLSPNASKEPNFHSVIYRTSDVRDPRSGVKCKSHEFHHNNVNNVQNGQIEQHSRARRWVLQAEAKLPYDENYFVSQNRSKRPILTAFDINQQQIDEELEIGNRTMVNSSALVFGKNVYKRATVDPKKTTCLVYLQADHMFFQKYGTEESCIEVMTRHIQRVNSIYKNTDFNQDGKTDNITFMVKRIKVHTVEALKDPLYRFPQNYGVEKFLELFSEEDYDAFCLAYMFTYRDFEMGTLGLAWTGDLKNAGGVCEKNGHYRGSMKSLNTGIVTLLNYGKHVPPAVSHVTLAHEIGHNFGSPHDPEQCTPGGEDGNFIMFARATSGDKKNNNKFSPCSLKSINPVLNYKARSSKGCFTEPKAAICGNGVVEEGEQCDCGWEEDCRDQCCFPMRRYPPTDEPPCMLTPRSICSPSQGPCCTNECQVKFGDKCRDDNGCRDESFCNGREAICPPSVNKPNKTICNKEFVCFMGECTGSICLAYGLESCQCIPRTGDPKTKACELCCKLPGDDQPCLSSFDWNQKPYDIPDMYSKPGTPCNDYSGYCDVFQMCREVDPSGPLATLRKLLLSEESIASFKRWIMEYWYIVTAILTSIFTLLFLSTKYLGKRPNLKLKSVTIIHKSTTEAVRLPPDTDGVTVVHPGIHSKVPFKRKVRDGKIKRKRKAKNESTNNNLNSPTKQKSSPKKKKRVSAPVTAEETTRHKDSGQGVVVMEVPQNKVKKSKISLKSKQMNLKKNTKNKEVIDYSAKNHDKDSQNLQKSPKTNENEVNHTPNLVNHAPTAVVHAPNLANHSPTEVIHAPLASQSDPVNKVQNWLKSQYTLPKSKSTPVGLADKSRRSPHKRATPTIRPRQPDKSKSVGNISDKDKMKLQVVYKPPFKFSIKLRKPEKTSVVIEQVKNPSNSKTQNIRSGVIVRTSLKENECAVAKPTINETASSNKVDQNQPSSTVAKLSNSLSVIPDYENVKGESSLATAQQFLNLATLHDIDDNSHTVHSDLEVLLSENDYENVD